MNVLVACEFSGIIRDAFSAKGHDAISCDLLPTESPGPHIQGDVTAELRKPWDLVIACPPCTYLSYAGTAHWNKPGRAELRADALEFFKLCLAANAARVCVENPFGLPNQAVRPSDQIINPFDFGEPIRKRTCLWLKGLPLLWRADDLFGGDSPAPVPPPEPIYVGTRIASGKPKARYETDCAGRKMAQRKWHRTEAMSCATDEERRHERSRFFPSIARAMAEQWGSTAQATPATPPQTPRQSIPTP